MFPTRHFRDYGAGAVDGGALVYNGQGLTMNNVTITNNTATTGAGGLSQTTTIAQRQHKKHDHRRKYGRRCNARCVRRDKFAGK
jgi:hypothetical protein